MAISGYSDTLTKTDGTNTVYLRLYYTATQTASGYIVRAEFQIRKSTTSALTASGGETTLTIDGTTERMGWSASDTLTLPASDVSWRTIISSSKTISNSSDTTITITGANTDLFDSSGGAGAVMNGSVSVSVVLPAPGAFSPKIYGPGPDVSGYEATTTSTGVFPSINGQTLFDKTKANLDTYYKVGKIIVDGEVEGNRWAILRFYDDDNNELGTAYITTKAEFGEWGITTNFPAVMPVLDETIKITRIYSSTSTTYRSTLVNTVYGSVDGRTRQIQKIYGSVGGKTRLVHLDLGEIPRPGTLVYYTDSTYTTTKTVRIITQEDLDSLCSGAFETNTWTTTLEGVEISNKMIKEVTLPTWATSVGDGFLCGCSRLDKLDYSINLKEVGAAFLANCSIFNQDLDLFYIESFGPQFLRACEKFNKPLDISKFTEIPYEFLMGCHAFNQPLDTSGVEVFGDGFLRNCQVFNQPVDLSSATKIGSRFLSGCHVFNQPITIPYSVTSIAAGYFLYNCKAMVSTVTCDAPATVTSNSSSYAFAADTATASCYVTGIPLAGGYAQAWKTKFADRTSNPYRKLIYGSDPILVPLSISNREDTHLTVTYGVTSWDMNGDYTSGTVTLYGDTKEYPTTRLASYTGLGATTFDQTGLVGNTKYYYRSVAVNNGGLDAENRLYTITKPTRLTVGSYSAGYSSYNRPIVQFWYRVPPNGGAYPQTITYRYKTTDGTYGPWIALNSVSVTAQTTYYFNLTVDSDTAYNFEFKTETEVGSATQSYTLAAIPTHIGPVNVKYKLDDSNTSVQDWLSTFSGYDTGTWFVSGQSTPRITIPQATSGELQNENLHYVRQIIYGHSTSTPAVGVKLTNMGGGIDVVNGGTVTAKLTGYLAFGVQLVGTNAAATREEMLKTVKIIDNTTGKDVFNSANTLSAYFETNNGTIYASSGATNTIMYVPCTSGRKYTISLAVTGGNSVDNYEATITNPDNNYTHIINYQSTGDMSYVFDKESISSPDKSGIVMSRLVATDLLKASNTFYEGGMFMQWLTPTFEGTAERVGRLGGLRLRFEGTYSALYLDALNNGNDLNAVRLEYRILDYTGATITDWARVASSDVNISEVENSLLDRKYVSEITLENLDYAKSIIVQMRASDYFYTSEVTEIELKTWNEQQVLTPANYEIEIWDWKTNTFVADISYLVSGDISIDWELNDIEELNFSIDMINFEKKCQEMGVESSELLKPYAHDIRVRRNGKYIVGCQLVETNVQVPNNSAPLINIKCTGFLNLFKDRYITESWSGFTYAEIARRLVSSAQKPTSIFRNPTGDIDTSYWLAGVGTLAYSNAVPNIGNGYIACRSSSNTTLRVGSQLKGVPAGTHIKIDVWVKAGSGKAWFLSDMKYITQETGAQQVQESYTVGTGNWQHVVIDDYVTMFDEGYLAVRLHSSTPDTGLAVDEMYVTRVEDEESLCDMKVTLGTDTASPIQNNTREVAYDLQNVKDALTELVSMGDDNFDFEFTYDRKFNIYDQKGTYKPQIELEYPGNVDSMTVGRSAANLVNKVRYIGSGIGDERLEVTRMNRESREVYGTRETIVTDSNVTLTDTLDALAIGELYDRKDPTNLPTVTIKDGSVNPDNVETGDYIIIHADDEYMQSVNDTYRIVKIATTVDEDGIETVKLTVEPQTERPDPVMVRYIRESLAGSSANSGNHWVEVQAYVLQNGEYVNVAKGASVYGSASVNNPAYVVDGSTTVGNYSNMSGAANAQRTITIDLGDEYPVEYVRVWHYFNDNRIYFGSRLSVGNTLPDGLTGVYPLEYNVWGPARYSETSDGRMSTNIQDLKPTQFKKYRYIKNTINGNYTSSGYNVDNWWAEIQVYDMYGNNVARNKTVTTTAKSYSGSLAAVVDGDWGSGTGLHSTPSTRQPESVIIDLGEPMEINYIKVWHYPDGDDRTFIDETLSVGNTLTEGNEPLEKMVWHFGGRTAGVEANGTDSAGGGRVSTSVQED